MIQSIRSPWQAVYWYIGYCHAGGVEISLAAPNPDPTFSTGGFQASNTDLRMGEDAALAFRIRRALNNAVSDGLMTICEYNKLIRGAKIQFLYDQKQLEWYAALEKYKIDRKDPRLAGKALAPTPPREMNTKERIAIKSAVELISNIKDHLEGFCHDNIV